MIAATSLGRLGGRLVGDVVEDDEPAVAARRRRSRAAGRAGRSGRARRRPRAPARRSRRAGRGRRTPRARRRPRRSRRRRRRAARAAAPRRALGLALEEAGPNQRCGGRRSPATAVPEARTCGDPLAPTPSASPILRAGAAAARRRAPGPGRRAAAAARPRRRPSRRRRGTGRRPASEHAEPARSLDGEVDRGRAAVGAVAGQVPGDDVELVAQQRARSVPSRRRPRCRARAEHEGGQRAASAAARFAAIRSGCTRSPVEQLGGLAGRRRRYAGRAVRSVAHSACQAPSARSSTWSAAARCRVAASWGVVSAARRTSTESTGLALCGIDDEPPPTALGELADLGPGQHEHVAGDPAAGVGAAATSASPTRVTGRRVGVPGRRVGQPEPPGQLGAAARARCRPAPPTCTGKVSAVEVAVGVEPARSARPRP